jgi:hypothetical protein
MLLIVTGTEGRRGSKWEYTHVEVWQIVRAIVSYRDPSLPFCFERKGRKWSGIEMKGKRGTCILG